MTQKQDANAEVRRARDAAAALHQRIAALDDDALDLLFRDARSHNGWSSRKIPNKLLRAVYELTKMGPTSSNSCPARFLFLTSDEAKQKLSTVVAAGNVDKVVMAPVVVIIAHDTEFHRHMPRLFAHNPGLRKKYANDKKLSEITAWRNGSLQGAYLMLAARSLGLDCGPMSGFDNAAVDKLFFDDMAVRSNFICALGYGDVEKLFQRLPRLEFDEACEIR